MQLQSSTERANLIYFLYIIYPSLTDYAGPLGFELWTPLCVGAMNDLSIFENVALAHDHFGHKNVVWSGNVTKPDPKHKNVVWSGNVTKPERS